MSLKYPFKFTHKNDPNLVYTAYVPEDGRVKVSWEESMNTLANHTSYRKDDAESCIAKGYWLLVPEPLTFPFKFTTYGNTYLAEDVGELGIKVSWTHDDEWGYGKGKFVVYSRERFQRTWDSGAWTKVEETVEAPKTTLKFPFVFRVDDKWDNQNTLYLATLREDGGVDVTWDDGEKTAPYQLANVEKYVQNGAWIIQ